MKNGLFINEFGTKEYYLNDQLHRIDGPAIEWIDGRKEWYYLGVIHRIGGPAAEYPNGDKGWYVNGELHRMDGPAAEFIDGRKWWYYHDKKVDCKSQREFEQLVRLRAFG
jgi:hypothetical protein